MVWMNKPKVNIVITSLSLKPNLFRPESPALRPGEGESRIGCAEKAKRTCAAPSPSHRLRPSRGKGEVFAFPAKRRS